MAKEYILFLLLSYLTLLTIVNYVTIKSSFFYASLSRQKMFNVFHYAQEWGYISPLLKVIFLRGWGGRIYVYSPIPSHKIACAGTVLSFYENHNTSRLRDLIVHTTWYISSKVQTFLYCLKVVHFCNVFLYKLQKLSF